MEANLLCHMCHNQPMDHDYTDELFHLCKICYEIDKYCDFASCIDMIEMPYILCNNHGNLLCVTIYRLRLDESYTDIEKWKLYEKIYKLHLQIIDRIGLCSNIATSIDITKVKIYDTHQLDRHNIKHLVGVINKLAELYSSMA